MIIPLILVLILLPHSPFFIEYKVIYHFTTTSQTIYGYLIQNVTDVYSNGTVRFELYQINMNSSQYVGPVVLYDNLNSPTSLYYFPNPGKTLVERGNLTFQLIGTENGYYIYQSAQHLTQVVSLDICYYVNDSGVPYKIVFLQYGLQGLVSNVTYILYSSNLINPNEKIYFPQGLEKVTNSIGYVSLEYTVQNIIFSFLVIVSIVIVVLKIFYQKPRNHKIE